MLNFPISSALSASVLSIFYIFLTVLVIRARRSQKIALGVPERSVLEKRASAHENFSNYTPLFLILLTFFEMAAEHRKFYALAYGCLFFLGRLCHAYSILVFERNQKYTFRVVGMAATFFSLVSLSIFNLMWGIQNF
jgi:uncharacterized protein